MHRFKYIVKFNSLQKFNGGLKGWKMEAWMNRYLGGGRQAFEQPTPTILSTFYEAWVPSTSKAL
jgi:hypothetical protein